MLNHYDLPHVKYRDFKPMKMRPSLVLLFLCTFAPGALANPECDALKPQKSKDIEDKFKGKLEGKIGLLVGRLAGGKVSLDGEYSRLEKDVLKDYPKSDKLYVWQNVIYLICIQPNSKIDFQKLLDKYLNGPPNDPE